MSRCQVCHERDAVVHLTEVVNDTVTTSHLCSRCAAERGIALEPGGAIIPVGGLLAEVVPAVRPDAAGSSRCPACDATLAEIRASGRVGCPTCWVAFERQLTELVRRYHGATQHVGLSPIEGDPQERRRSAELQRLRAELRRAVDAEEFEQAAGLRDQLRALEEEAYEL